MNLSTLIKKHKIIMIFIFFSFCFLFVSLTNDEHFNDFESINDNDLHHLIKLEQENCTNKNICGLVNDEIIPCPPQTCNDTCICKNRSK